MSWDIYLVDDKRQVIKLNEPFDRIGGVYSIGGSREAYYNITFNYYPIFEKVLVIPFRNFDGLPVKDTIEILEKAINSLSEDDETGNYWDATEYNTKKALSDLLYLAELSPNSYWMIV